MPKRMFMILMLLVALALACTRSAPIRFELPQLQLPEGAATPTQEEVFLPDISTGDEEMPAEATEAPAVETAAPGAAPATETPGELFLPDVNTGDDQTQAQPTQTETPQAAAAPPAPNIFYLPHVGSGRDGEAGGAAGGQGPAIRLEANPVILSVGEDLTVVGRPTGIGLPYYDLVVQDQGAQQAQVLGQVTYENESRPQPGVSQVLELVSVEGSMDAVTFVLRAKAPGTAAVQITATGEVQTESGAFTWSGGSSQAIAITVTGE